MGAGGGGQGSTIDRNASLLVSTRSLKMSPFQSFLVASLEHVLGRKNPKIQYGSYDAFYVGLVDLEAWESKLSLFIKG